MLTQLLFGEAFEIKERGEKFSFITNFRDEYHGWVDNKMITALTAEEASLMQKSNFPVTINPITRCITNGETIFLPGGSLLPFYDADKEFAQIGEKIFRVSASDSSTIEKSSDLRTYALAIAQSYIHAPYLWGGKSIFGIDCSGLVQVVMSICGKRISRDASQQVNEGSQVPFLAEAQAGDLAFFDNHEGRIVHVGILLDSTKIIHASGEVKINTIDSQGIQSDDLSEYSHQLRVIKRVL